MLMNMKMPTLVGIFIFISSENFLLGGGENEKSFITSGPDLVIIITVFIFYSRVWQLAQ